MHSGYHVPLRFPGGYKLFRKRLISVQQRAPQLQRSRIPRPASARRHPRYALIVFIDDATAIRAGGDDQGLS